MPAWAAYGTLIVKPNFDGGGPRRRYINAWNGNGVSGPEIGLMDELSPQPWGRLVCKGAVRGNTELQDFIDIYFANAVEDAQIYGLDWRDAILVFCQGGADTGSPESVAAWPGKLDTLIGMFEALGGTHSIFGGLTNVTPGSGSERDLLNDAMQAKVAEAPTRRAYIDLSGAAMQPTNLPHLTQDAARAFGASIRTIGVGWGMDVAA